MEVHIDDVPWIAKAKGKFLDTQIINHRAQYRLGATTGHLAVPIIVAEPAIAQVT